MVYDHTKAMPQHCAAVGEGNPIAARSAWATNSRQRLPEDMLKQVYDWALSLGLEIPVTTAISKAEQAPNGFTNKLDVVEQGVEASNVTIEVIVPAGAKVVNATAPATRAFARTRRPRPPWPSGRWRS